MYQITTINKVNYEVVLRNFSGIPLRGGTINEVVCTDIENNEYEMKFYTASKKIRL